jgi:23S rRNA (guanosine2251-2'-O)-methyltransferase
MRLVCGLQPVREAIRAHGRALEKVLVGRGSPELDALARFAQDQGAAVLRVDRGELDRLAKGARHQGAIAFAPELSLVDLASVAKTEGALVVALDELEDPQNFGAIVRSAVGMGATAVVWPEHHSAPLTPATFRASAGAVEHATLCRVKSLPEALASLAASGLAIVGLDAAGEVPIDAVDLRGPCALVVGAEGKGLRRSVKRACSALARLPMAGPVGSLNASVSAAIALYEARRQRGRREKD